MMPLWTTTTRPVQSRCGWAFFSVGSAVRRPSGVADAVIAFEGIGGDDIFKPEQFAGASANSIRAVADDRDAGRVIAAVFKLAQPLNQDRKG